MSFASSPTPLTDIAGTPDSNSGKFASIPYFKLAGDVDGNTFVNALDLLAVRRSLNIPQGQPGYDRNSDIDDTHTVDASDLSIVNANMGHTLHVQTAPHQTVRTSTGAPVTGTLHFDASVFQPITPVDLIISNTGQKPLTIASVQIVGPDAGTFSFQVVGDPAGNTGFILAQDQTKTIRITGLPGKTGPLLAYLRWWHNDPSQNNPFIIALNADVTGAVPSSPAISSGKELAAIHISPPTPATSINSTSSTRKTSNAPPSHAFSAPTPVKRPVSPRAKSLAPVSKSVSPRTFATRPMRLDPLPKAQKKPASSTVNTARAGLFNGTPIATLPPSPPAPRVRTPTLSLICCGDLITSDGWFPCSSQFIYGVTSMDRETLLAAMDFARARLSDTLTAIEKAVPDIAPVLAWRPGPGRVHIAWQAMHCAATHDKYLHVNVNAGQARNEALVAAYGGGSTPSDQNVPALPDIRATLESAYQDFRTFVAAVSPEELARKLASGRSIGESILLLTWHEAHHQGQIHLTWNLYKQAHGIA